MSEEMKFDHFKDINELLEHIDLWYREDDIEYTRWFGLEDLYNLKIYIKDLQQKVEQLENIRKEAIKVTKDMKQFVYDELVDRNVSGATETHCKIMNLLNILNKGSDKE